MPALPSKTAVAESGFLDCGLGDLFQKLSEKLDNQDETAEQQYQRELKEAKKQLEVN